MFRLGLDSFNKCGSSPLVVVAPPQLPSGAIANYNFVQGADAAVLYDSGAEALHGQLINSPTWSAGGLALNGTSQYVRLPQDPRLNFDNIDFSVVLKVRYSAAAAGYLVSRGAGATAPSGGWGLMHNAYFAKTATGNAVQYNFSNTPGVGTDHIFVLVARYSTSSTSGTAAVHVNGAQQGGSPTVTAAAAVSTSFFPLLGARSSGSPPTVANFSNAIFKRAIFYRRALTAQEIALVQTLV